MANYHFLLWNCVLGGATLLARKKRALEAELNSSLAETCDNIEPGATWETDTQTGSPQVSRMSTRPDPTVHLSFRFSPSLYKSSG